MKHLWAGLAGSLLLYGCNSDSGGTYTLYRNSPLNTSMRLHWASFDTNEKADVNGDNCNMAARLLNANVAALAKAAGKEPFHGIGFWCEPGKYSQKGSVPAEFKAAFPTDTDSPLSW